MRKPDFFIVGAPKCGTTALNDYLSQHPEIFMGPKEMHYFGTDFDWRRRAFERSRYLEQFASIDPSIQAGEASVWYLYSQTAAQEIHDFRPDAKIIAMIRNPLEMLPSLHAQLVAIGEEDITDFGDALDAEVGRVKGRRLPRTDHPGFIQALFYSKVARYSEQIERYFDAFGRSQVSVIVFDNFKDDTETVYRDVLEFLCVDSKFRPPNGFPVINARQQPRSHHLWRAVKFAPVPLKWAWRLCFPGSMRGLLLHAVSRILMTETREGSLFIAESQVRNRLQTQLVSEVERLSALLGRDLSHWVEGL